MVMTQPKKTKKRGRGRPPVENKGRQIGVYFDTVMIEALEKAHAIDGGSLSGVVARVARDAMRARFPELFPS